MRKFLILAPLFVFWVAVGFQPISLLKHRKHGEVAQSVIYKKPSGQGEVSAWMKSSIIDKRKATS